MNLSWMKQELSYWTIAHHRILLSTILLDVPTKITNQLKKFSRQKREEGGLCVSVCGYVRYGGPRMR